MKNDIDPSKAFVAEDGYEYEDLADYLIGKKVDCARNNFFVASANPAHWRKTIYEIYLYYSRDGYPYAAGHGRPTPPGAERFAETGDAEGARSAGPKQAPVDPVHAAT